jgi:hypothetical protein
MLEKETSKRGEEKERMMGVNVIKVHYIYI